MKKVELVTLLLILSAVSLACEEHIKPTYRSSAWRRNNQETYNNNNDYYWDNQRSDSEIDREAEESQNYPMSVQAKSYSNQQHQPKQQQQPQSISRGGYNNVQQHYSVKLMPASIAIECTVKDPLEHVVWLQARCPEEYDRGDVIAKGSVSLLPSLFSVSVTGEDGTFVSTLTIIDPKAHGTGGVFRCEAWPHFGYGGHGRHKRDLTPTFKGLGLEGSDRTGRSLHDPWNAIIIGGTELIDECFYSAYDDKWRSFRPNTARSLDPMTVMASENKNVLSSELNNLNNQNEFIQLLNNDELKIWNAYKHNDQEELTTTTPPPTTVEIKTNMLPSTYKNNESQRPTANLRIPKSGIEIRTNMLPINKNTQSRIITVRPEGFVQ